VGATGNPSWVYEAKSVIGIFFEIVEPKPMQPASGVGLLGVFSKPANMQGVHWLCRAPRCALNPGVLDPNDTGMPHDHTRWVGGFVIGGY
jgi:hypothetical protein